MIVYNTKKTFKQGHTCLGTMEAAISAIKLVEKRELPKNKNKYFIQSLIKLTMDQSYIERLNDIHINFNQLMKDNNGIDERKCR